MINETALRLSKKILLFCFGFEVEEDFFIMELTEKLQSIEHKEKMIENMLSCHKRSSGKIFANNFSFAVNDMITEKIEPGMRDKALRVYMILEKYAFDNETFEVSLAQSTIANELKISREYVCRLIAALHNARIIRKVRRGFTQCNKYVLMVRQRLTNLLAALNKVRAEKQQCKNEMKKAETQDKKAASEKKAAAGDPNSKTRKKYGNKKETVDAFNDFEQRRFNFTNLEKFLRGQADPNTSDDLSQIYEDGTWEAKRV